MRECGAWFEQLNRELHQRNVKVVGHFNVEFLVGDPDSPEGPRVVVTDASSNWIAASEPVSPGSSDWKTLAVDFVAPQNAGGGSSAILLSIKRKPRFSYDEPTNGTVWFDDFSIKEQ